MAGAQRRRGLAKAVRQLDKFSLTLTPRAELILKSLGAGNPASQVAKMVHCARSTMNYWTNKFIAMGALRLQCKDVIKIYSLTPYGSKLITRSEGFVSELLCLEDYPWKFEVFEWEHSRIDWVKLGSPRNWEKLGCRVGGVRVVRTSGAVIIHPGRFKGWDTHELEYLAVRTVEWVKNVLQHKFGMVLSDEGVRLHDPIFRIYSEEAREDVKHGTFIVEGVGSIDQSPPERRPHEEYSGSERARARLLLPDTAKRIESKVDELTKIMGNLTDIMTEFTDVFKQMIGAPQQRSGSPDYVS